MKIYFGIGNTIGECGGMLQEEGVNRVLISYTNFKNKEITPLFTDIMVDSGAFTNKAKKQTTVEEYINWLKVYLNKYSQIKTYVNLDDVKNHKVSLNNYNEMVDSGLNPLPVYHYGEPEQVLKYYCKKCEYVGIGGMARRYLSEWEFQAFWDRVNETYPDNKFHMFGVTNLAYYTKYQPESMDSMTWFNNGIYMRLPGYKNGIPAAVDLGVKYTGNNLLITRQEIARISIKATLEYEKLEWLNNVKNGTDEQSRLF